MTKPKLSDWVSLCDWVCVTSHCQIVLLKKKQKKQVIHSHLNASRRAPRSLSVVCLISSKLFSNFTQDWNKQTWQGQTGGERKGMKKEEKILTEPRSKAKLCVCVCVCVCGIAYITGPVRVSFPVFLFLLLVGCGHDLSMSLHPGIEGQDVLYETRRNSSTHQ